MAMKKRSRYKQNAYKFHRYVLSRKRNDSRDIIEKLNVNCDVVLDYTNDC